MNELLAPTVPGPRYPNAKRPTIPEAIRARIFTRDVNTCVYCGATKPLTIDHVFPFAQGGTSEESNMVVACAVCNRLAGDRVFGELAAKREWVRAARKALGRKALDRIEAALIAGDTAGAMREMER